MPKEKPTPRNFPELVVGIRVQYSDLNEAMRAGQIVKRDGSFITVQNALKERKRIKITQVKGYWRKRVKASPNNMIRV